MGGIELELGYVVGGRYRVVKPLGQGGMGTVYLVQHEKTEERFALKILDRAVVKDEIALERFRREARAPARIDSDHVARVVDTDVAEDLGGVPFLVMEYLKGRNLQSLSDEIGALPPGEVLVYMRQIALALDKAHAIGIVHRDLKPENLFLTTRDDGSPCVKVLDFGIAKLSGATGDLEVIKATSTGDIFGTPLYMSPEQCLSETQKISAQSDVWALGLLAHRLLTGRDYWTADNLTHLIAQIAYEALPKASERGSHFGPDYDAWFARCLCRDLEQRFKVAGEAVEELATALGASSAQWSQRTTDFLAVEAVRVAVSVPASGDLALKQTSSALARTQARESLGRHSTSRRFAVAMMVGLFLLGGFLAVWQADFAPAGVVAAGPPEVLTSGAMRAVTTIASSAAAQLEAELAAVPDESKQSDEKESTPSKQDPTKADKTAPLQPRFVPPKPKPVVDPLSGRH